LETGARWTGPDASGSAAGWIATFGVGFAGACAIGAAGHFGFHGESETCIAGLAGRILAEESGAGGRCGVGQECENVLPRFAGDAKTGEQSADRSFRADSARHGANTLAPGFAAN